MYEENMLEPFKPFATFLSILYMLSTISCPAISHNIKHLCRYRRMVCVCEREYILCTRRMCTHAAHLIIFQGQPMVHMVLIQSILGGGQLRIECTHINKYGLARLPYLLNSFALSCTNSHHMHVLIVEFK